MCWEVVSLRVENEGSHATKVIGAHIGVRRAPVGTLDYLERNREAWERWAGKQAAASRDAWQSDELLWGIWNTPESDLRLLRRLQPAEDVIELGSGTAAIPAWLARRRVRPVALDFCRKQLDTAERLQDEFNVSFPLLCANAEQVPFDAESFDVVISEYGASLWCDPRLWLPEANRLLRPDGELIFFASSAILTACTPSDGGAVTDRLVRDYFASYRVEFPGETAVEFHLTHSHWIRLLRASGFVVENLVEVRPPRGTKARFQFASIEWARRWPSEEIWVARKVGSPAPDA